MPPVIGISDRHTVMADLDNMSFKRVKWLAHLTMKHFRLEGFIILKTSPKHYHVVFDKPIRKWSRVLKVIAWMGIVGNNRNLWKWLCMQAIKGNCTLRVVYRYGSQKRMVKEFLACRRRVLWTVKRLGVY